MVQPVSPGHKKDAQWLREGGGKDCLPLGEQQEPILGLGSWVIPNRGLLPLGGRQDSPCQGPTDTGQGLATMGEAQRQGPV